MIERLSQQASAWFSGLNRPAIMVLDQRTSQRYLQQLALQIDSPAVEASLAVQGTDVVVNSGQVGRKLDIDSSVQLLAVQLQTLQDGAVPLLVRETTPVIMDANAQAELARKILSQPLTITLPGAGEGDPGPWDFDRTSLAQMLAIGRVSTGTGEAYQIAIQAEVLRTFLTNLAPQLNRQPANARFIFNDDTHQLEVIQPSVTGRALDIDKSIETINAKLGSGEHSIALELSTTSPEAPDTITAAELGITELVHSETSYFRGSSAARVQNIKAASSRFHGLLVAPGETFSMAQALGDISLDNGYAEALIILGDRTIKGVGGGVCQVSTTLFRTVFFAGFPVVERYAHAYRVSYYEQGPSSINVNFAGLDATVFVPIVDFKFTNDTPNWLLMETYVNGASLTWKFYSTSDGRSVDWNTTGVTNVTDPGDPVYRENPDMAQGELKQVEWPSKGADVSIQRTVSRNGETYFQDRFNTHYIAWQEVWEYGPGTEIPPKTE